MDIPHDLEAEDDLLAILLHNPSRRQDVIDNLEPSQFYSPANQVIYQALSALHREGTPIDTKGVIEQARAWGLWHDNYGERVPIGGSRDPSLAMRKFVPLLADLALRRCLLGLADQLMQRAQDLTDPSEDIIDSFRAELVDIELARIGHDPGDVSFAEFMAIRDRQRSDWVIPALMREDWRVVVVGPEGFGKSMLLAQVVFCAGMGVHPFATKPDNTLGLEIEGVVRPLLIDLENPKSAVLNTLDSIAAGLSRILGQPVVGDNEWIWHRPRGIDIRKPAGRRELEDVLRRRRPNVVVISPVYKAFARKPRETDEDTAMEVTGILDDLRTKYRFGLLLEAHAPKAQGGVRELSPIGSSVWLRWPDLGFKLLPIKGRPLDLERGSFRGDRMQHGWPPEFARGKVLPWEGRWPNARADIPPRPEPPAGTFGDEEPF